MKIKHELGAVSLTHEGQSFEADEDGYIDAPFELAQLLLNQTEWSAEEPKAVGSSDPHSALFVDATPVVDQDAEAAAAKAAEEAQAKTEAEADANAAEARAELQAKAKAAVAAKLKAAAATKAKPTK